MESIAHYCALYPAELIVNASSAINHPTLVYVTIALEEVESHKYATLLAESLLF